jgi:RNA polymerase sigma factor (TIGR02999 family)
MSDVTRLLDAARTGDRQAAADLLPPIYDDLRKLAAAKMAADNPGHTLNAIALVHEAYLRLVGDQQVDGRGHFFAAAAEATRRILVGRARARESLKRGGDRQRVALDPVDIADQPARDDLTAVNDALTKLEKADPLKAELVKLRVFADLTGIKPPPSWAYHLRRLTITGFTPEPGSASRLTAAKAVEFNSAGHWSLTH